MKQENFGIKQNICNALTVIHSWFFEISNYTLRYNKKFIYRKQISQKKIVMKRLM